MEEDEDSKKLQFEVLPRVVHKRNTLVILSYMKSFRQRKDIKSNKNSIGKYLIILCGLFGGIILALYTTLWVGIIACLVIVLSACINEASFLMFFAIKKEKLSRAIQIGETELRKETVPTGTKLNLIAAYYKNKDIDKARVIMDGIDIDKLSWNEKKVTDSWKVKINESQK